MSHYDNRAVRIRAFQVPLSPAAQQSVKLMLLGLDAPAISWMAQLDLAVSGIHIAMLRNGRQYIDSVEELPVINASTPY